MHEAMANDAENPLEPRGPTTCLCSSFDFDMRESEPCYASGEERLIFVFLSSGRVRCAPSCGECKATLTAVTRRLGARMVC